MAFLHPADKGSRMTNLKREKFGLCPFCGREGVLTFHHLIPRKLHRRERFKKNFTREDLQRGMAICRLCHDGIHDAYDEMTLARRFDLPARLKANARLRKHFNWVAKQKV
jgi:hypothetical protein